MSGASRFKPAREPQWVKILAAPPPFVLARKRHSGARANGLRYQRQVDEYLESRYGAAYVRGPWLEFFDGVTRERRYCQPDGLLVELRRGRITVIEAKYTHTQLAYWQLFELYMPVVRALFGPQWHFAAVEICAKFDPMTPLPVRCVMRKNVLDAVESEFNVHIWRADRRIEYALEIPKTETVHGGSSA